MSHGEENSRILDSNDPALYEIRTKARGPEGRVPINEELLRHAPSGNLFAFSQNAGMGWNPSELGRRGISHPEHSGRHSGPGRTSPGSGLPRGAIGR